MNKYWLKRGDNLAFHLKIVKINITRQNKEHKQNKKKSNYNIIFIICQISDLSSQLTTIFKVISHATKAICNIWEFDMCYLLNHVVVVALLLLLLPIWTLSREQKVTKFTEEKKNQKLKEYMCQVTLDEEVTWE